MSADHDAASVARAEMLPLLEALCSIAREEQSPDQAAFFERIRAGVEHASEPDDLAGPFMELSTSAFRGFRFSLPVELLLDRVLAVAQAFAMTLAAPADEPH